VSSSPSTDASAAFRSSLDGLDAGDLRRWRPLSDGLTVADLLLARPDAEPAVDLRQLLGQPAVGYRLAASEHAPVGVIVWAQHDELTLVEVRDPRLIDSPPGVLGPPAAVLDSGLGGAQDQLLWPALGLLMHVTRSSGRVARLYGHHAATVQQMESSPLVAVRIERHPR
jgi:hypothetical protein